MIPAALALASLVLPAALARTAPGFPADSREAAACTPAHCRCIPAAALGLTTAGLLVEQRDRSVAVVLATVRRIDTLPGAQVRKDDPPLGPIVARLDVHRRWKGDSTDTLTVAVHESAMTGSSCDLPLVAGVRYVVFARAGWDGRPPTVSQCGGTRVATAAGADPTVTTLDSLARGR